MPPAACGAPDERAHHDDHPKSVRRLTEPLVVVAPPQRLEDGLSIMSLRLAAGDAADQGLEDEGWTSSDCTVATTPPRVTGRLLRILPGGASGQSPWSTQPTTVSGPCEIVAWIRQPSSVWP